MPESSDLSLSFYGKDAEECEDFIRTVRLHASQNHKLNDDSWIAEQVYPCFGGKALRWYMKQPREVRADWELLQQALLQEWSSEPERKSIQPTNPHMFNFPFTKFTIACLNGYTMAGMVGHANLSRGSFVFSQTPAMNAPAQQFEIVPLDGGYGLRSVAAPQFYASAVQIRNADIPDLTVQLDDSPYPWKIYPAGYPNSFFICSREGHVWDQWDWSTANNIHIILQIPHSQSTTNRAWSFIAAHPQ